MGSDNNLMPGDRGNSDQGLIRRLFPARQIFFRAHGDISYFTISPAVQITLAAFLVILSGWVVFASARFFFRDDILDARNQTIAELEAANAGQAEDIATLQEEILTRTDALEARQSFLQEIIETSPAADIPAHLMPEQEEGAPGDGEGSGDSSKTPGRGSGLLSGLLMGSAHAATPRVMDMEAFRDYVMGRLDAVEEKEDALAADLSGLAETRLVEFDDMLAPFKIKALDLANAAPDPFAGQGGPFVADPDSTFKGLNDGGFSIAAPYPELQTKWSEMLRVYEGMRTLPLATPAENFYVSSRFGGRIDPYTKTRAVHYGLDLAGWPGEHIFTAGDGVVVKAGTWGAYGRMVEIDHGNGFITRYGHMKKVLVSRGQTVKAGDIIGEMGCSGRCTSTHLHYEVVFNGTNRNPQPFMEAPEDVQQTQRQAAHDAEGGN